MLHGAQKPRCIVNAKDMNIRETRRKRGGTVNGAR